MGESESQPQQPVPPPRVAWVAAGATLEKFSRLLGPLAVGLADELIDLTIVAPDDLATEDLPSPPFVRISLPHSRFLALHYRWLTRLEQQLTRRKIQLVHSLDAAAAHLARRLAHNLNCQHIATAWAVGDGKGLGGLLHHPPAAILAASSAVREDLLKHSAAPPGRIEQLVTAVYRVRSAACFIQPGRRTSIVVAAPPEADKPIEAVAKAFSQIQRRDDSCLFFAVVSGQAEHRLRELRDGLGLRNELTIVDPRPSSRLPGIFKAADIFVSAATPPYMDVHALLAMAAGIPVLVARPGNGDFLIAGQTCLMFDPGNAAELSDALAQLLTQPQTARDLANAALDYLARNNSLGQAVQQHIGLYRKYARPSAGRLRPLPI